MLVPLFIQRNPRIVFEIAWKNKHRYKGKPLRWRITQNLMGIWISFLYMVNYTVKRTSLAEWKAYIGLRSGSTGHLFSFTFFRFFEVSSFHFYSFTVFRFSNYIVFQFFSFSMYLVYRTGIPSSGSAKSTAGQNFGSGRAAGPELCISIRYLPVDTKIGLNFTTYVFDIKFSNVYPTVMKSIIKSQMQNIVSPGFFFFFFWKAMLLLSL